MNFELDDNLKEGIYKLIKWLHIKEADDFSNTVSKSIEILNYILIREYYTNKERELLNEIRSQYVRDLQSKK